MEQKVPNDRFFFRTVRFFSKNFAIHKLLDKESTFSINADEQTLLAIFCFEELWRFLLNLHIVSDRVIGGLKTFEMYYSLICELVTISITIDQC